MVVGLGLGLGLGLEISIRARVLRRIRIIGVKKIGLVLVHHYR